MPTCAETSLWLDEQLLALLAVLEGGSVAAVSIRGLDEEIVERLRVRAARHGRSMEAEARSILTESVSLVEDGPGLADALMRRFGDLGGVDLELPPRSTSARAADLDI